MDLVRGGCSGRRCVVRRRVPVHEHHGPSGIGRVEGRIDDDDLKTMISASQVRLEWDTLCGANEVKK